LAEPQTNPLAADGTIKSRPIKVAGLIIHFVIWFLLVAICYRNTQSAFLRAESGWYEFLSHSDQRQHFLTYLLTYSYHGHYTPLAFAAEFELTRLVGPQELFWKWRQITVLALLATTISVFARRLARANRVSMIPAVALGGGIAALFVFQPRMTEFVAWPFMVMQLGWIVLTVGALAALVQIAQGSEPLRWVWIAVACAYGSMHTTGLGLVTVGATAVAFLLLRNADYTKSRPVIRRQLIVALAAMIVLAAIHGACMYWLPNADLPAAMHHRLEIKPVLGFVWMFLVSVFRSLIGANPVTADSVKLVSSQWLFGAAFLVVSALFVIRSIRIIRHSSLAEQRVALLLHLFSILAFVGVLVLIIARQLGDGSASQGGFLMGPRYLVPVSFTLLGSVISLALSAARRARPWVITMLLIGVGITAYAANQRYAARDLSTVDPRSTISHAKAWSLLVATAREARAAGLPVPNVPMDALTVEFYGWDLKLFEPLLSSELRLPPGEKIAFTSWDIFAAGIPEEYAASVPSFRPLMKLMNLESGLAH
jgi:hypothetical protein